MCAYSLNCASFNGREKESRVKKESRDFHGVSKTSVQERRGRFRREN